MLVSPRQLNQAELALLIQQYSSGAAFSGNFINYVEASGYLGPLAVTVTGNQVITGSKRFLDPILIAYSGGTGAAPSARFVLDQDLSLSGALTGQIASSVAASTGNLSSITVTGSSIIQSANFTGLGGTLIIYSGNRIFVSGAAGGGGTGNSNVSVTGSSTISSPNFTGLGSVVVSYNGTYVRISGAAGADSTLSGYVESNFVHRGAVDELVSGIKTFTGNPLVAVPTVPSGVVNLFYLSGVSGVLSSLAGSTTNTYYITGTGVVAATSTGTVTNTFNITSGNATVINSGTVNNTFNGTVNTSINISQPTGNFVNVSFYFDEFGLTTGLNMMEAVIGRSFFFTGYAIGVINTGTQGYFSGSFYQRTPTNTKTNFIDFSLNSGLFFVANGGFGQEISGMNRLGLDIYRIGTGITGLSVGAFGVGY